MKSRWQQIRRPLLLCTLLGTLTTLLFLSNTNPPDDHRHRNLKLNIDHPSTAAIVTLTSNQSQDISELCLALKSLLFLKGGPSGEYTTSPILIFNEGDLSFEKRTTLEKCTSRPTAFPIVNLQTYPVGFDPDEEWNKFTQWTNFRPVRNRSNWSYAQMIRFWTTLIWNHPAIQQYETIMRIDTDSCFVWQTEQNFNPLYQWAPGLMKRYVYQSNYDGQIGSAEYIVGLYEFASEYMTKHDMTPANPTLWNDIRTTYERTGRLLVFQTNFEISRVSFFRQENVRRWNEALVEREPFGVFRRRWGDAQFRVLTMAMFAKEENVLLSKSVGYLHGRERCEKNFIEEVHQKMRTNEKW